MEGTNMKISIYQVIAFLGLSLLLLLFTSCGGKKSTNQVAEGDHDSFEQGVVHQDEISARAADINILANEANLSVDSVEQAITFQEAFAEYADSLLTRFPEQISSVWVEPVPSTKGHIKFVEEVPLEITLAEIKTQGLNPNNVVLTGNGMISMEDHVRRAELASEALASLGYQNTVTFFDPISNEIHTEVQLPEGAPQPNTLEIANAMQVRIQANQNKSEAIQLQGKAATVDVLDLNLTVLRGSGPIVTPQHSRGGNWLRDDGFRECTSGWAVSGPNGDGIITAAHCTGLNQFEQPGVPLYSMTWRNQVHGTGGDVEYHTTTHIEPDDFYATSTAIRDVTGTRSTNTMVGNSVCVYGRSSNVRTCNHTVQAVGLTINSGGVTITQMARSHNATSTIGGDSGGGWSWSNTAWGVHHGIDGSGRGYFTPARQAEAVLNVTIKR